jgi:uncharacterized protein (DUF1778 family)
MDSFAKTRSERVDLRMTPAAKRTLNQAAAAANKTLTEFLLDSGLTAAFATLADRRSFVLDDTAWAAFTAALDAPPADNPRLRALMQRRRPWES